ncbi:MAG: formate dehydrogenase accessory protein FdhE [Desulfovibrionaceae bacterium]
MPATDTAPAPDLQALHHGIEALRAKTPELDELLRAFGHVTEALAEAAAALPEPDLGGFAPDPELLRQGAPLLDQPGAPTVDFRLTVVAPKLFPALAEAFPALAERLAALGHDLADPGERRKVLGILREGRPRALANLARRHDLPEGVLAYVLECLARPGLERLARALAPGLAAIPWTVWHRGTCPVCGALPDVSLLRLGEQEPTEYLKNVSGQRWLSCSVCAHQWRHVRTRCPGCEHDEQKDRQYLYVDGNIGERAEICPECHRYLLTLDAREMDAPPEPRTVALGLLHLDLLARARGLAPLVPRPWNAAAL